jgi:hypothetical protein
MPTALQERRECDSVSAVQKSRPFKPNRSTKAESIAPLADLLGLLEIIPVDLARVTDELRRCGLEKLVVELGSLANASATGDVHSLEQAAVVLGTDRLRFLAQTWPHILSAAEEQRSAVHGSAAGLGDGCTAGSPSFEPLQMQRALQLALLRWLQGGLYADPFAAISGWRGADDIQTRDLGDLFLNGFVGDPAADGSPAADQNRRPAPRGATNP